MAGYIDRYTEAQVAAYSKKIKGVYGQAAKEVRKKLDSFLAGQKVIGARMLEQVKRGEITEADYKKWLSGQVFIGDRWKAKLAEITDIYMNADRKAREMLGGTTKQVFAESANRTAYDMSKELRGAVSFNLYDTKTVDRLLKDDPKMLPEWKINEKKDYIWNEKRVQNAVTQGIIQGESVYDIGEKLYKDLSASNANKMDMFARTAVTGAQNAGRVERMKETEESGIKVKKKWIAAHDNRTRDTHADLDGQEVDVDEKFKTFDGREIDYPGDPTADPDLVYNCRCTLVYVYPKYEPKTESHHFESYSEWKAKQQNSNQQQQKKSNEDYAKQIEFTDVFTDEQQNGIRDVLSKATEAYPLPYDFDFVGDGRIPRNLPHETMWDLIDEHPDRKMDFGESAQYVSIKKADGSIERRIDILDDRMDAVSLPKMYDMAYKSHKAFEAEPGLSHALFNAGIGIEGTALHEYGHAVQDYCGFFLRQTEEGTKFEDWIRDFAKSRPMDILSISRYAGESLVKYNSANPSEIWAEAFVTSFDPHHDTTAWKTANEIMKEFKKRFGHLFKKR